jgi:hypothetical protein
MNHLAFQPTLILYLMDGGMEQSPKTINVSGNGMEECSIHILTGSVSNNVEETY